MQSLTYSEWLKLLFLPFSYFFDWLYSICNFLINNYLFITLIYVILTFFIISLFFIIIDFIRNSFSKFSKKSKNEVE